MPSGNLLECDKNGTMAGMVKCLPPSLHGIPPYLLSWAASGHSSVQWPQCSEHLPGVGGTWLVALTLLILICNTGMSCLSSRLLPWQSNAVMWEYASCSRDLKGMPQAFSLSGAGFLTWVQGGHSEMLKALLWGAMLLFFSLPSFRPSFFYKSGVQQLIPSRLPRPPFSFRDASISKKNLLLRAHLWLADVLIKVLLDLPGFLETVLCCGLGCWVGSSIVSASYTVSAKYFLMWRF